MSERKLILGELKKCVKTLMVYVTEESGPLNVLSTKMMDLINKLDNFEVEEISDCLSQSTKTAGLTQSMKTDEG